MNIYVEVHGCTANYGDDEIIRAVLEQRGNRIVESIGEADILFLVTCIVIDTTEQRMLSRLRIFAKTGKKIVVAGCMASARREAALEIIPNAIFIKPADAALAADVIEGTSAPLPSSKPEIPVRHSSTRAIIQISEGCASSCTYCITRKARGKLVSYDPEKIVECCRRAIESGCKELWITAQDSGVYGMDLKNAKCVNQESRFANRAISSEGIGVWGETPFIVRGYQKYRTHQKCRMPPSPELRLPELLRSISEIPGDFRIRVGMMGVKGAIRNLDGLIEAYRLPKVYKFLHLPVQSGDDAVLKRMARGYKATDFEKVVRRFRAEFPGIMLSTDVIVGFPGESEGAFGRTIDLLRSAKPDIINVKRFSPRPGTKAYKFPERTPTQTLKERSRKVAALQRRIGLELGKRYVGKEYSALVSEETKNGAALVRLDNYKPVIIKDKIPIGRRVKVKVTGATAGYLVGEIAK